MQIADGARTAVTMKASLASSGETIIAHFGGDEIYLPSPWSDKRWHVGLEDKEPFDPGD
jgi:hypothetical protein